ncbi:DUF2955 domain-containing protein [Pseudomonas sp. L-22-4S-12]|uniref:DUF2955 domain-containing protein n=1 Tax=Pseudomonas sp. L-22-4S-12 TaxID=2610893 RepID=UPI0013237DE4|nr:DUF2955 domain-containing protein [Pseudomonas sp. L-22-4S-12]MWV16131.1 DUF2955 domain-containing protein [Pseudomonas sp. L-22-4S-12]
MNPPVVDPRPQRALRLACGTALGTALGFGLALPLPFLTPMLVLVLLALSNQPLGLKGGLSLALVVALTCGSGLLLSPLLNHSPVSGVLLVALGLFFSFRFALRGGSGLLSTLQVVGLTMVSAAGTASLALGQEVVEALIKAVLLTTLCVTIGHWLFPEPAGLAPAVKPAPMANARSSWIALRAMLVVMPAWLLALIDPASYMPLVMKSANLGQQVCGTSARDAGRELLGSTLLGGALAIAFWALLSILPHLWLFFLLMLLFVLLMARRLYRLASTRFGASFWLNTCSTLIILLGQSVQDSASGKDVYTAFAIRMGLFILVTLYACAAVYLIDQRSKGSSEVIPCS